MPRTPSKPSLSPVTAAWPGSLEIDVTGSFCKSSMLPLFCICMRGSPANAYFMDDMRQFAAETFVPVCALTVYFGGGDGGGGGGAGGAGVLVAGCVCWPGSSGARSQHC